MLDRVAYCDDAGEAVAGAALVRSAPRAARAQARLFASISEAVPDDAVLASSSSAIVPSLIAEGLARAEQLIVGHPGNPPYLIP